MQRTNRRTFLKQGIGTTSLLASGVTLPGFLCRTASAAMPAVDDRILVVIQMTGGNDGLNTVIPVHDDAYHRARPTLRIAADAAHALTDELSLHPQMEAFKGLYDDGTLSVISNVGYPNPDRSHFRSMDIWHTASLDPEAVDTGWLGRVADRAGANAESPAALHLDDAELPVALHSAHGAVPSIRDIRAFSLNEHVSDFDQSLRRARTAAHDDLLYVQRIALSSCRQARRISEIDAADRDAVSYPGYALALRLRQIARLISADFGPRVYYTSFGGFDTHAQQGNAHGSLLQQLSESVAAFRANLEAQGLADRVLIMTFSEFGRRVAENGSRGTDHGAAAPMFLVGDSVRSGVTGGQPLLNHASGDVPHRVDFRDVYAAVLDDWLNIDHKSVLGQPFAPVELLARR